MSRSKEKFSRRALLKRLGVGAALLPILESEWLSAAPCAGASGPKRAFFIVWANGMLARTSSWATAAADATYTLPPHMASLEPYKQDILLLDGISYNFVADSPNPNGGEVSGHACFQGMLTGAHYKSFGTSTANNVAGGLSIDQFIGSKLKAGGYAGKTALNSMVYSRSTARLSWSEAAVPIVPDADPFHVYSTWFVGAAPAPTPTPTPGPTPGPTPVPMPVDRMLLARKSVLDYVGADIARFANTVGTADKVFIEAHLSNIRDTEMDLSRVINSMGTGAGGAGGGGTGGPVTQPPAGTACVRPALGPMVDVRSTNFFHTITKMQIDLAVAIMAADATRAVVLQLGDQGDPDIILTNLGFTAGGQDGNTGNINAYHSIAHRNAAEKVTCDTWFQSQIAYAIGAMKNVTEAGGKTMLDSSVLVAMNNMRTGNHEYRNVPALLAGNCGGYFKMGRSIKLPANTPQNGLLVAVANAVGTPTPTFGHTMYGGELAALKG